MALSLLKRSGSGSAFLSAFKCQCKSGMLRQVCKLIRMKPFTLRDTTGPDWAFKLDSLPVKWVKCGVNLYHYFLNFCQCTLRVHWVGHPAIVSLMNNMMLLWNSLCCTMLSVKKNNNNNVSNNFLHQWSGHVFLLLFFVTAVADPVHSGIHAWAGMQSWRYYLVDHYLCFSNA